MMNKNMHRKPEDHKWVQTCLSKQREGRCQNRIESVTLRKLNQIMSRDNPKQTLCSLPNRTTTASQPNKLLTNFYNVSVEPFKNRKGNLGAVIGKAERFPAQVKKIHTRKPFIKMEKFKKPPSSISTLPLDKHQPKSWLRNSTWSCNSDEPGPMSYYPKGHEISQTVSPPIKTRETSPHEFLKNSSVPVKLNAVHRRHTSFEPGPGRYETWHRKLCPCPRGKILCDHLQVTLERENLQKFRLQKYQKIDKNLFCDANLRHIPGGGYTYLFKTTPQKKVPPRRATKANKADISRHKIYISGRYRNFLTYPKRLSLLPLYYPRQPPLNIRFNTDIKVVLRKQRHAKVPFGCRLPRFPGDEIKRPRIEKPRPHFVYQPVKPTGPPLVQSRLMEIPHHRNQTRPTIKRRRMFRFERIGEPKSLITADDYKIIFQSEGLFYNTPLKIESFFKNNATELRQSKSKQVIPNRSIYSSL